MQHKLTEGPLLGGDGRLCEAGYATSLVKRYDRAAIRAGAHRIKEWDYYCVTCDDAVLALTIADNGYMGLDSVSLIDIPSRWQHTKSFIRALPMGSTCLPASSESGTVEMKRKHYHIRFENEGAQRVLSVRVDDFLDGKPLDATVTLYESPRDSMVIATPFPGNERAFYYNQKINCLSAYGQAAFDGKLYNFPRGEAMAVLDWGRGVWTYRNTWYWGSVSGRVNGVPFGLNLGYGFGDTQKATENMLFWDGEAHKLSDIDFGIPKSQGGRDDFMSPWNITSSDDRLRLTFTPVLDRASRMSVLVIKSDQHQVFGHYEGKAVLDDGTVIAVPKMLGFAEKVTNHW